MFSARWSRLVAVGIIALISSDTEREANAALEVASPFTDHMVLQRDMPVPVWGKGDAGVAITVTFADQAVTTQVMETGSWRVDLAPLEASFKSRAIKITAAATGETIDIADVVVGEVWICAGQSNMQMGVKAVPDIAALIPNAQNIRSFQVENTVAFDEQEECNGEWIAQHPNSAVAFAFAYFLEDAATVPIGIILTSWGSSSIEAWMPRDMTATVPHFKTIMDEFDADSVTRDRINNALARPGGWSRSEDVFLRRQPNILYNAMMKPLIPFACRGLVWYQGERNTQSMHGMLEKPWFSRNSGMLRYGDVLQKWMLRYREEWNRDDFHFLVVMLPGYGKTLTSGPCKKSDSPIAHSWAWMREAQLKAYGLRKAGVANTIDLGHIQNVHPKDKLPIGQRLALLAARDTLGIKLAAEGPVLDRVVEQGDRLVVHFQHAEGLKTTDNQAPRAFWLSDESGDWFPAKAEIKGQTVALHSGKIQKPAFVRYAFAGKPDVNLINISNLPAYPFRTDTFDP